MLSCAISVDLDEIPNYCAIHGVDLPDIDRHAVYDTALQRLDEWAKRHEIPLTLFAVGSDLVRPGSAAALRTMHQAGHEIANHTLDHYYDLTRRDRATMRTQVGGAIDLIGEAVGAPPVGFRAPGYVTTQALYEVLAEHGVAYSSSVFPCPWYYAPKAALIGVKAALGRPSKSLVDDPRVLLAPRGPYRIGQPYYRTGQGVLEFPIQVTPGLRLPYIGTSLMMGGPAGAEWLTRRLLGTPLINLELHGIDVLDSFDGLQALASYQPDVRISARRKLATLDRVVATLKEAGYSFLTLAALAQDSDLRW
jgi:peptidoglycan/xylan/chitin deacetylase (PgdA/CDA1 family)